LLPDGDYEIDWGMAKKLKMHLPFRKKNEPFTEEHKDIASAIQKVTETIIFHIVRHYRQVTGATNLSLAGGVALNCTMNGKLRYAKLFDDIFVQPASHDGGIPLGATLITYYHHRPEARRSSLEHVYLGTDCPDPKTCMEIAGKWSAFLDVQPSEDVAGTAAQLIASGKVIGWFQGTSEYGPRALGNRSILADPRPAENKEIINYKIKMREGFRPFAPSILAEKTGEVFCLPDGNREYPYMSFILKVRDKYRPLLGAITHVDGTARLHTVTRETNERYYDLIEQFSLLTGIPVVLNTSFNNNAEPIVDTPDQAINCFLTTELDMLIIDTLILKKKSFTEGQLLNLYPLVFPFVRLFSAHENGVRNYFAGNTYNEKKHILSPEAYTVLKQGDGTKMLGSLLAGQDAQDIGAVLHEIKELWSSRIISMSPEEISTL
jgi:carbamoyltransferase